jgi:hypothetical protein
MEPESSLPRSQEPATGPYPEPDESVPQHRKFFLYDPLTCYLPFYAYAFAVFSQIIA